MSRNLTEALLDQLDEIERRGTTVVARGQEQREILSALVSIDRPVERVVTVPGRRNNVFAQIAETLWVLAGRDDLDFLGRYLPRAVDFSDDGLTWRAAYGPRLRSWAGRVDQLAEVRARLVEDPNTKRAVISIFDPGADYADTKDVPCNNWLQFIHRDGVLHLNVTVRANDVIWGFTGINVFEWSVLHELLAATLGWRVGRLTWFVGTLHVYERHYDVAASILRQRGIRSAYEFGIPSLPIGTGLDELDDVLGRVFEVERLARAGDDAGAAAAQHGIGDPFWRGSATMLRAYNAELEGAPRARVAAIVRELAPSDFRVAAIEHLSRRWHDDAEFADEPDGVGHYLRYFRAVRDATASLAVR
jgi:thymidylate synthase